MASQDSSISVEVVSLLKEVKPLGETLVLEPVTIAQVEEFEQKFRLELPIELKEWLFIANGANVNPGGVFGLKDFAQDYSWHPNWLSKKWIPIASDGCGDSWILACGETISSSSTHPVFFIDQCDLDKPAYVVASGLWKFLRFLLEDEIIHQKFPPVLDTESENWHESMRNRLHDSTRRDYWPFTKEMVLQNDPCLNDYTGVVPFPWDLEE